MKNLTTMLTESINSKLSGMIDKAMKFCDNANKMKKVEEEWDEEFPDDIFGGDLKSFMEDRKENCKIVLDNTYTVLEEGYIELSGNSKKDVAALTEEVVEMMKSADVDAEFHEIEDYVDFTYYGIWKALFGHTIEQDLKK